MCVPSDSHSSTAEHLYSTYQEEVDWKWMMKKDLVVCSSDQCHMPVLLGTSQIRCASFSSEALPCH